MSYPSDKVQATFTPFDYTYQLKPGDVINISIGSVTPLDFDFIRQYTVQMGDILYLSPSTGKNGAMYSGTVINQQIQIMSAVSQGFVVDSAGNVSIPRVGDTRVAGKTVAQVGLLLEELLKGYFESPKVRVQLINFQFTVLGEVTRQGRYTTYKDKTSIVEALTMAGYFTEYADIANVKIVRTMGGETTVTYINLLDDKILASRNFYIYPEDIIVVAPLKAKFWRNYVVPDITKGLGLFSATLSLVLLLYTIRNK
jgi:polysaccharide export outer membrane protein